MITRWPSHNHHRHTSKITIYGWSTRPVVIITVWWTTIPRRLAGDPPPHLANRIHSHVAGVALSTGRWVVEVELVDVGSGRSEGLFGAEDGHGW